MLLSFFFFFFTKKNLEEAHPSPMNHISIMYTFINFQTFSISVDLKMICQLDMENTKSPT